MPDYVNTAPVVLEVDGQMVAIGEQVTCKSTHPAVTRGHLTPAPKADTPAENEES